MNRYAAGALKAAVYTIATLVILLAVAVGLLRLMLPELPEYRDEIQTRASSAIGLGVEFERLDARWRFSGPELIFQSVTLKEPASGETVLNADEVSVGAAFLRMLRERRITIGRIGIRGSSISVERDADGRLTVQGRTAETSDEVQAGVLPQDIRVTMADVNFTYRDSRARGGPLTARLMSLDWIRRGDHQELEFELEPSSDIGSALKVEAAGTVGADQDASWDVYVDATALNLARVASILPERWPSPRAGLADIEIWASFSHRVLRRATANVLLENMRPTIDTGLDPYGLQARIEWAMNDQGWLLAVNELRIERGGMIRPDSFLQVSAELDTEDRISALDVQSGYLNMQDVRPLRGWMPAAVRQSLDDYDPSGELMALQFRIEQLDQAPPRYSVEAELRDAGVAARGDRPGVRGISGNIRADESNGRLMLDSRSLVFDAPALFSSPLTFLRADATIVWRGNDQELSVLCDRLLLEDEWLITESSFELDIPSAEQASPRLDLTAEWRLSDLSRAPRYLPVRVMPKGVVEWLEKALVAGSAEGGSLKINGALSDFPFDDDEGELSARVNIRDATLRFALQWPDIEEVDALVELEGLRLQTTDNAAVTMGNRVEDAYVGFENLRSGLLNIRGSASGPLQQMVLYGEASPISGLFAGRLADITAAGDAQVDLEVTVPVTRIEDYEVRAEFSTENGKFELEGFPHPLTDVSGMVEVTRAGATGEDLDARFLGSPMTIDLMPATEIESELAAIVIADSRVSAEALTETAGIPLGGDLTGEAAYQATVRFPRPGLEAGPPVTIQLESDLEGLGIALPEPLRKEDAQTWPFRAEIGFPATGRLAISGFYGQTAKWILALQRTDTGWDLDRGNIHLGPGLARMPTGAGLHFSGTLEWLRLGDWLSRATAAGDAGPARWIRSADVRIDDLYAFGQRVLEVDVQLERNASDWMVQIAAPTAAGSIIVPTDLDSGRSLVLDMERLFLVEGDPQSGDPGRPTNYPPISLRAADFRLGERIFGTIEADFNKTERGLETGNLSASAETFSFSGSASWWEDLTDPSGQRSSLKGEFNSTNVGTTLSQLGYYPGIYANTGYASMDFSISGPPRADFLDELDGEVRLAIEDGRLEEVEPGAGRVFGLMSVAALPRRLALDFRDVFDKGLGFDEISGTFRIVNGDAYTCDLSLKGSVADIGVVGRAGLAQRDYNQTALVSADVGGTLPAVGAVVAGPQAAAALLLFSQIFKKPLQELAQAYYQVSGNFDDPSIERTDARRFAATSELAGCLTETS